MSIKERTYVTIDLSLLKYNLIKIKENLDPSVKICAVLKANAYGHGAVYISKYIEEYVDYFSVATIDEALELRQSGITIPILILGYTMKKRYIDLVKYNIEQTIYTVEDAQLLNRYAQSSNIKVKIHIAVDTGMGRIGVIPNKTSIEKVKSISKLANLQIEGIFSHFSTADESDKAFTLQQINKFKCFFKEVENVGISIPIKHICNSAAIIELDDYKFDMVRAGIVMYGHYPSDEIQKNKITLLPILEWKAHIVNINTLNAGSNISYGNTYTTKSLHTKIATVNVGYADGYPRQLSNVGRVLIHGQFYPIVGRICMDQFMIDISNDSQNKIKIEDEVTLIGKDGDNYIYVEEIAKYTGTINYEILCNIGERVPRIYINA